MRKINQVIITSPEEKICQIASSSPNDILCLNSLGVYWEQGQYRLAEAYFRESLPLLSKLYGEGAAVSIAASTFSGLGSTYRKMRKVW